MHNYYNISKKWLVMNKPSFFFHLYLSSKQCKNFFLSFDYHVLIIKYKKEAILGKTKTKQNETKLNVMHLNSCLLVKKQQM